jgi:hypothetical protein
MAELSVVRDVDEFVDQVMVSNKSHPACLSAELSAEFVPFSSSEWINLTNCLT